MPKLLNRIVSFLLLCSLASSPAIADKSNSGVPHWSTDLVLYGFHYRKLGSEPSSTVKVAASENVIAVGIQNPSATSPIKPPYLDTDDVSLVLFDVRTGKLRGKTGWTAISWFDLFPTSQGNFVLHLWSRADSKAPEKSGEKLVLVSSTGEELKRVELGRVVAAPVPGHPEYEEWGVLSSPSRRTLLLRQPGPNGHHYEIVDADALRTTIEWNDTGKEPVVVAISDKNMLGESPSASGRDDKVSNGKGILTVRAVDGVWKSFLAPGTNWQFLTDDVLISLQEVGQPNWGEANSYRFIVSRLDGSSVLTKEIQRKNQYFYASTPMQTSPDGRHVAAVINCQSVWWLWRELDMVPENSTLYVWAIPNAEQVLSVKLRSWLAAYSLSPSGSWIVVADENTLKVIPVPNKASIISKSKN
jgi:hypothetical protein